MYDKSNDLIMEQAKTVSYNGSDIEKMFSRIARRYDLINHLASFGLDFMWRKKAAQLTQTNVSDKLVDFCCGTGDLAFAFAKKRTPPAEIVGCDFSQSMLNIFESKCLHFKEKKTKFSLVRCDCTRNPLPSNSFDIASCAFGLRNIPDLTGAINEMYRLLKPGGQVCILEFSLPKNGFFSKIYSFYFFHILPRAAGILSGRPDAYKHLSDSVQLWHSTVNLKKELENAGFAEITETPLTMSVAVVYMARKIK